MGSTVLTTNPVTDLTAVRRHLLAGKLAGARHEVQILSDEGADDGAFYSAKSVVSFFEGDEDGAAKLLQRAQSVERTRSSEFDELLYGQMLVEGAICKSLMRDTHADLVEKALETAEHLLTKNDEREQAAASTYVDILDHVALSKIGQAQELHHKMTMMWADSSDATVQSWRVVFDMAALRLLCERTRLADRLFAPIRGQATGDEEYEITCVSILRDVLQSDAPKRTKLAAVRVFLLGRVRVWH